MPASWESYRTIGFQIPNSDIKKLSIAQLWQKCLVTLRVFTENDRFCFISEYAVYCRKCTVLHAFFPKTLSFSLHYWRVIEAFKYLGKFEKDF
jgi:hypothetical protein